MSEIRIQLPPRLAEFAEMQVATGQYADVSDYIRTLLRERKEESERLAAEIQKGLDSADSDRSFDEIWRAGIERGRSRAA